MTEEILPVIALIPLKRESSRFPRKNFSEFCETNLLENTINKIVKSKSVSKILISTDSPDETYGLFNTESKRLFGSLLGIVERSTKLCKPESKTDEVVYDLIKKVNTTDDYVIIVCQVTSPNWSPHYITYALNKLKQKNVDTVISVSPDLKPNGCFYIFKKSTFLKKGSIYTPNMYLVTIPWDESTDIDYYYQSCLAQSISKGNLDN